MKSPTILRNTSSTISTLSFANQFLNYKNWGFPFIEVLLTLKFDFWEKKALYCIFHFFQQEKTKKPKQTYKQTHQNTKQAKNLSLLR